MARTKQTARKACCHKVPRKTLIAQRLSRKTAPGSSMQIQEEVINTQQFSVKFDDQAKCEEQSISGAVIACKNCQAVLTSQSKVLDHKEYDSKKQDKNIPDEKRQKFLKNHDSVWICEFCLQHNNVPRNYIAPREQNPCFVLQKAKKGKEKNKIDEEDSSDKILIFCVDISGSMDLRVAGDKTRLGCVKQALIDEVNRMKFEGENIKIGIITFGSQVTLIGDANKFKEKTLDSALYNEFDKIIAECKKVNNFCQPLEKSYASLKKRIQGLSIYGSTALGPGLLSAIQLCSKGAVGSKVIICTDGQANVGIGGAFSMERFVFYDKAAAYAKKSRVSVSILSLKGDRCNLKELSKLSLGTGGSVLKIDPHALGTEFSKIAKEEILGTQAHLIVKVNKIFEIVSHDGTSQVSKDKTTLTQDLGNFSSETELTFEFNVLDKETASKIPQIDLDIYKQKRVPMQIQLTYIGRNGTKFKQIITDWRELTQNENEMFDGANFGLFAASVLQRASQKIKKSEYKMADSILKGYWSMVKEKFQKTETKTQLEKFNQKVKNLEKVLHSKQRKSEGSVTKKKIVPSNTKSRSKAIKKSSKGKSKAIDSEESEEEDFDEEENMSSDEEEQIICRAMRQRSRSRSRSPQKKQKLVPPTQQKQQKIKK